MAQHRLAKGVKLPPVFNIKGALNVWNDCLADFEKEMTAKGRAEEKAAGAASMAGVLRNYLRARFGDASEPLVASLKDITDPDRIVRITNSAVQTDSLTEIEALFAAAR